MAELPYEEITFETPFDPTECQKLVRVRAEVKEGIVPQESSENVTPPDGATMVVWPKVAGGTRLAELALAPDRMEALWWVCDQPEAMPEFYEDSRVEVLSYPDAKALGENWVGEDFEMPF